MFKDIIWFLRHGIGRAIELWWRCDFRLWEALDIMWEISTSTLEEWFGEE